MEWSKEEQQLLLQHVLKMDGIDSTKSYKNFEAGIDWDAFEFNGRTAEDIKNMFHDLIRKVRKYRTMKEIITDAEHLITSVGTVKSKIQMSKIYPDYPIKPKSAYGLFLKKRSKKLQGRNFAEKSSLLSMEWKHMSETRKEKYTVKAKKLKEKYAEEMKIFSQNHPEAISINVQANTGGRPTPPLPCRLYANSRVEKYKTKHPELNHAEAYKACLKKYESISDRKKLKWIKKGKDKSQEYEKEIELYKSCHKGSFKPHPFHLTKDEQRIYDQSLGKPLAPPKNLYQYFSELKRSTVADMEFAERSKELSSLYHKLTDAELDNLETSLRQEAQNYAEKYTTFYKSLSEDERQRHLNPTDALKPYSKILTGAKLKRKPAIVESKDVTNYKQLSLPSLFKKPKESQDESDGEIPPSQAINGSVRKRKRSSGMFAKKVKGGESPQKEESDDFLANHDKNQLHDNLLSTTVPRKTPKKQPKLDESELNASLTKKSPKNQLKVNEGEPSTSVSKKSPKKQLKVNESGPNASVTKKSPKKELKVDEDELSASFSNKSTTKEKNIDDSLLVLGLS